MTDISFDELRKLELNILIYIDDICKKHNLQYFLIGGTLLGAVRHKGFIPWDDDIDIAMRRDVYEKFVEICNSDRYQIITPYERGNYYNFAKMIDKTTHLEEMSFRKFDKMGVYVDIFVLDALEGNKDAVLKKYKSLDKIRKKINNYALIPQWRLNIFEMAKRSICFFTANFDTLGKLQKEYVDTVLKYGGSAAVYFYITGGAYGEKDIYPIEYFAEIVLLEFEGHSFMCPKCYREYLKDLYGDYMTLPPKEKRIAHHNFRAYYR